MRSAGACGTSGTSPGATGDGNGTDVAPAGQSPLTAAVQFPASLLGTETLPERSAQSTSPPSAGFRSVWGSFLLAGERGRLQPPCPVQLRGDRRGGCTGLGEPPPAPAHAGQCGQHGRCLQLSVGMEELLLLKQSSAPIRGSHVACPAPSHGPHAGTHGFSPAGGSSWPATRAKPSPKTQQGVSLGAEKPCLAWHCITPGRRSLLLPGRPGTCPGPGAWPRGA